MSTSRTLAFSLGLTHLVACGGQTNLGSQGDDGGSAQTSATSGGTGGSDSTSGGQGGAGPVQDAASPVVRCPADPGFDVDAESTPPNPTGACPCTRRPGPGNSFMCPMGSGAFATYVIGPAGGTVQLGNTMATRGVPAKIEIPPGALAAPTTITITETECPPPASFVDGSPVYQFDPPDLVFAKPAFLTIPFAVLSGFVPSLALYVTDNGTFGRVSDSYLNAGFMQGSTKHLGSALAGKPKAPSEQACP